MKKTVTLFALLLVLFSGCKKETTTTLNPPPADPFAANDALISSNANLYIIADVEGLSGVTHINQQDTIWGVTAQWSQGHCSTGNCSYGGGVGYIWGSTGTWVFKAYYDGTGETQENLFVQNYTTYKTPANEHHGVTLYYSYNDKYYFSNITDNTALSWANIELVTRDATGQANTPTSTPYYVKLHFNCEFTNINDHSEKIHFKNAVARVKM